MKILGRLIPHLLLLMSAYSLPRAGQAQAGKLEGDLRSLVEAERAFALAAATDGITEAFLAYLATDGIVFRPGPINGHEWYRSQPSAQGILSWEPATAEISVAGDMGYTTGPFDYRRASNEPPVAQGQYFSVWRKSGDAPWKVVIDIGTTHPAPASDAISQIVTPNRSALWSGAISDAAAELAALIEVDRELTLTMRSDEPSLSELVMSDVRVLRPEAEPSTGIAKLRSTWSERPKALTWEPIGGDVSTSGDFGYTYGEYRISADDDTPEAVGNYVRVWRRDDRGSWKLVADVMSPRPTSA